PADTTIVLHGDVTHAIEQFWQDTDARYRLLRGDKSRPLLPPVDMFVPVDAFFGGIKAFARLDMRTAGAVDADNARAPTHTLPPLAVDRRAADPLAALKGYIGTTGGSAIRIAICADSAGRRETMQQFFAEYGVRPVVADGFASFIGDPAQKLALIAAPLHAGFAWPDAGIAFVTEAEMYAGTIRRTRRDAAR